MSGRTRRRQRGTPARLPRVAPDAALGPRRRAALSKRALEDTLDFAPAEMRRLGHRTVDIVTRHLAGLRRSPVGRTGTRPELRTLLEEPAPRVGRPPLEVLRRCERDVLGHTLAAHHPRFFGFIPACASYAGVLGDLLASGFNVFAGTWLEASGPAQVEITLLDWFRGWLGMPAAAGGLMVSGGSAANLTALVTAREALFRGRPHRERGRAVIYLSEQGHSSVERAARVIDIPPERTRYIPADGRFRMSLPNLAAAIARDRRRGLRPFCVVANAGSTNTGSIDPLPGLARLCRRERLWLHVDGAYGGFAVLTRRGRALLRGIGRADSVTLDPHKWLYAPFEAGCLLVRDRRLLRRAFAIHPEYMQDVRTEAEEVNFCDYGIQLTRSFRALKVWLALQMYGTRRIAAIIERSMEFARRAGERLAASPAFEILSPAALGVVCFRYVPRRLRGARADAARAGERRSGRLSAPPPRPAAEEAALDRVNEEITRRVREAGRSFFSSTVLRGRYSLRLCVLGHRTLWPDVAGTLAEIESTGDRIKT
jgi:glutamate/tyrosine decarboxylase-like PLP-dependent enzyme